MKIAFLGVRVPGHLNPMTTLARKLKARGHDVVFLSMPDTERFVRAAELPFIPFCENDFPVGSLAKSMAALSKLQGQAALEMAIMPVANTMESAFRNLPRTLRDTNADALVLYVHLTGNMRRPRRHWPEIRQVCAAYCKPMSQ